MGTAAQTPRKHMAMVDREPYKSSISLSFLKSSSTIASEAAILPLHCEARAETQVTSWQVLPEAEMTVSAPEDLQPK